MTLIISSIISGIITYIINEIILHRTLFFYILLFIICIIIILIYLKLFNNIYPGSRFLNDSNETSYITSKNISETKKNILKLKEDIAYLEKKLDKADDKDDDGIEEFTNYFQCSKYKPLKNIETVFNKRNISNSDDISKWDLYMPCGYNNVEDELKTIKKQSGNAISLENRKIYAIDGCDFLASKNSLWTIFETAIGRSEASKLMPQSFVIGNPHDIQQFKKSYKPGKLYFLKKNIQRKEGILLTRDYNEILEEATIGEYKIIQEAVENLYLINKRKINLRIYFLIICKNGTITGYLYKEGKCIYNNKDLNEDIKKLTNDREDHLTSLNLDVSIYKQNPETLKQLNKHLGSYKYNLLWNRIETIFKKLMSSIKQQNLICKQADIAEATRFQLFGADVIFDKKFHPYLLELNKGPSMKYTTETDEAMKIQLTDDIMAMAGTFDENDLNNATSRFIKVEDKIAS